VKIRRSRNEHPYGRNPSHRVAQLLYATVFSTISLIIVACAGCIVADTQLAILGGIARHALVRSSKAAFI
jgi:hypothetical protein